MNRRDFITLLGGAAAWPLAARAQQLAIPVVGYISPATPEENANLTAAFRKGLAEAGYVEGRNVQIEYRWANGLERVPELVADLVSLRVAVIFAPAGILAALAAKAANTTIPLVFSTGGDPVRAGVVASLNRPGGNITGIVDLTMELAAKHVGLLRELLPRSGRFAVLVNPTSPLAEPTITDVHRAASAIGQEIEILNASSSRDIDAAFASLKQRGIDALLISSDAFFNRRRVQLATLAVRFAVPVIYPFREFAEVGGLLSYGSSLVERDRQAGIYVGRILKGEKPANLPVIQAVKFEFVVNLQTARILGIDIPTNLLARADEVIE
jgi:putative tryptophan/tyrosine transport system substrate-binding protein